MAHKGSGRVKGGAAPARDASVSRALGKYTARNGETPAPAGQRISGLFTHADTSAEANAYFAERNAHIERVVEAQDNPSRSFRPTLFIGLGGTGAAVARRLSQLLILPPGFDDPSHLVRVNALREAIDSKDPRLHDAILRKLFDSPHLVRVEAVRGVGVLKIRHAFDLLVHMLSVDGNPEVRAQVALSLSLLAPRKSKSFLRTALANEKNVTALQGICDALARVPDAGDVEALSSLADRADDILVPHVCRALGNTCSIDAFHVLMRLVNRTSSSGAACAISQIAQKRSRRGQLPSLKYTLRMLMHDLEQTNLETRETAAHVLSYLNCKSTVNWILRKMAIPKAFFMGSEVVSSGIGGYDPSFYDRLVEAAVYASARISKPDADADVSETLRAWVKTDTHISDMALLVLGMRGHVSDIPLVGSFIGSNRFIHADSFLPVALKWMLRYVTREWNAKGEVDTGSLFSRSFVAVLALRSLALFYPDEVSEYLVTRYCDKLGIPSSFSRDSLFCTLCDIHIDLLHRMPKRPIVNYDEEKDWGRESFEILQDQRMGWTTMRFLPPEPLDNLKKRVDFSADLTRNILERDGVRLFCHSTSFHFHALKHVGIKVTEGTVTVVYGHDKKSVVLKVGDKAFELAPGVPHQIINTGEAEAVVQEVETPAFKDDIVRLYNPYTACKKTRGY